MKVHLTKDSVVANDLGISVNKLALKNIVIFNSIPGGRQGYSDSVKVTMRRDGAFQEMVYVVIAIATLIVSAILVWRIKRWYDRRKRQAQKKLKATPGKHQRKLFL